MILVELEVSLRETKARKKIFSKTSAKVILSLTNCNMDRKNLIKKVVMLKDILVEIAINILMGMIDRTLCKLMNKILKKLTCKSIRRMDIKKNMSVLKIRLLIHNQFKFIQIKNIDLIERIFNFII